MLNPSQQASSECLGYMDNILMVYIQETCPQVGSMLHLPGTVNEKKSRWII